MPKIFKLGSVPLHENRSKVSDFAWLSSRPLAEISKSKNLQFDVRSLSPGKFSFPYHFHRNAEELFVLFEGEATLRSPDGFQTITKGDFIFFEEGPTGAHQLYNHTDSPCVYLDIRTMTAIDVCEYPDSGKINILPTMEIFQTSSRVRYYSGEEEVRTKWPKALLKDEQES
ncbi:MAG: cupin domain-containing protein [bacterium]|nr:cupin domain-containing protein [bacterium]